MTLTTGLLMPGVVIFIGIAAYTFQRREYERERVAYALSLVQKLTRYAIDRNNGITVDGLGVSEASMDATSVARVEAVFRDAATRKEILAIAREIDLIVEVADGRRQEDSDSVISRAADCENRLLDLLRGVTVIQVLRDAWRRPGFSKPFSQSSKSER